MKRTLACLTVLLALWAASARADHALEFYPSFYPHEIRIEWLDLAVAARRLAAATLHAYVGVDPFGEGPIPAHLGRVESLRSYLVLTFNRSSRQAADRTARCAAATGVGSALAAREGAYVAHPYPVTPFHADYLQHFDLIELARARPEASGADQLKIRAKGRLAEQLLPAAWGAAGSGWDATLEEVDVQDLVEPSRISVNGWLGPPWLKEGWFHAWLLEGPAVTDAATKAEIQSLYQRLVTGAYSGEIEQINLERRLVGLLGRGCERVVLGYTVRREYFNNSDYNAGIENVGFDSHAGLDAPIFARTVKLKDYLWNGWLRVGIEGRPRAAWNPIGGFTDAAGRLLWAAVGDPAEFPVPGGATWLPDRVTPAVTVGDSIEIPPDAVLPEPGSGTPKPVGPGKIARARVVYQVRLSAFQDGTPMTAADFLYAYGFAFRPHDRATDAATALVREWLAGVRVGGIEQDVKDVGETKYTFQVQIVEVYLTHRLADPLQTAGVAPPWSTLPWQALALMEQAVTRGLAAFSQDETRRRGVPWLDLVRDARLRERLASLADELGRQAYVPPALKGLVTPGEAKARWTALGAFYAKHHHFLVTNGPYRLREWSGKAVVLEAFRDPSYPLGIGAFDRYAIPRRAFIARAEAPDGRLDIRADVEKVFSFQRSYKLVREAFRGQEGDVETGDVPLLRYVIVGIDGSVAATGTARPRADGAFSPDLQGRLGPGSYTLLLALALEGNDVNPEVKTMRLTLPRF